jgi:hypothetical protein
VSEKAYVLEWGEYNFLTLFFLYFFFTDVCHRIGIIQLHFSHQLAYNHIKNQSKQHVHIERLQVKHDGWMKLRC